MTDTKPSFSNVGRFAPGDLVQDKQTKKKSTVLSVTSAPVINGIAGVSAISGLCTLVLYLHNEKVKKEVNVIWGTSSGPLEIVRKAAKEVTDKGKEFAKTNTANFLKNTLGESFGFIEQKIHSDKPSTKPALSVKEQSLRSPNKSLGQSLTTTEAELVKKNVEVIQQEQLVQLGVSKQVSANIIGATSSGPSVGYTSTVNQMEELIASAFGLDTNNKGQKLSVLKRPFEKALKTNESRIALNQERINRLTQEIDLFTGKLVGAEGSARSSVQRSLDSLEYRRGALVRQLERISNPRTEKQLEAIKRVLGNGPGESAFERFRDTYNLKNKLFSEDGLSLRIPNIYDAKGISLFNGFDSPEQAYKSLSYKEAEALQEIVTGLQKLGIVSNGYNTPQLKKVFEPLLGVYNNKTNTYEGGLLQRYNESINYETSLFQGLHDDSPYQDVAENVEDSALRKLGLKPKQMTYGDNVENVSANVNLTNSLKTDSSLKEAQINALSSQVANYNLSYGPHLPGTEEQIKIAQDQLKSLVPQAFPQEIYGVTNYPKRFDSVDDLLSTYKKAKKDVNLYDQAITQLESDIEKSRGKGQNTVELLKRLGILKTNRVGATRVIVKGDQVLGHHLDILRTPGKLDGKMVYLNNKGYLIDSLIPDANNPLNSRINLTSINLDSGTLSLAASKAPVNNGLVETPSIKNANVSSDVNIYNPNYTIGDTTYKFGRRTIKKDALKLTKDQLLEALNLGQNSDMVAFTKRLNNFDLSSLSPETKEDFYSTAFYHYIDAVKSFTPTTSQPLSIVNIESEFLKRAELIAAAKSGILKKSDVQTALNAGFDVRSYIDQNAIGESKNVSFDALSSLENMQGLDEHDHANIGALKSLQKAQTWYDPVLNNMPEAYNVEMPPDPTQAMNNAVTTVIGKNKQNSLLQEAHKRLLENKDKPLSDLRGAGLELDEKGKPYVPIQFNSTKDSPTQILRMTNIIEDGVNTPHLVNDRNTTVSIAGYLNVQTTLNKVTNRTNSISPTQVASAFDNPSGTFNIDNFPITEFNYNKEGVKTKGYVVAPREQLKAQADAFLAGVKNNSLLSADIETVAGVDKSRTAISEVGNIGFSLPGQKAQNYFTKSYIEQFDNDPYLQGLLLKGEKDSPYIRAREELLKFAEDNVNLNRSEIEAQLKSQAKNIQELTDVEKSQLVWAGRQRYLQKHFLATGTLFDDEESLAKAFATNIENTNASAFFNQNAQFDINAFSKMFERYGFSNAQTKINSLTAIPAENILALTHPELSSLSQQAVGQALLDPNYVETHTGFHDVEDINKIGQKAYERLSNMGNPNDFLNKETTYISPSDYFISTNKDDSKRAFKILGGQFNIDPEKAKAYGLDIDKPSPVLWVQEHDYNTGIAGQPFLKEILEPGVGPSRAATNIMNSLKPESEIKDTILENVQDLARRSVRRFNDPKEYPDLIEQLRQESLNYELLKQSSPKGKEGIQELAYHLLNHPDISREDRRYKSGEFLMGLIQNGPTSGTRKMAQYLSMDNFLGNDLKGLNSESPLNEKGVHAQALLNIEKEGFDLETRNKAVSDYFRTAFDTHAPRLETKEGTPFIDYLASLSQHKSSLEAIATDAIWSDQRGIASKIQTTFEEVSSLPKQQVGAANVFKREAQKIKISELLDNAIVKKGAMLALGVAALATINASLTKPDLGHEDKEDRDHLRADLAVDKVEKNIKLNEIQLAERQSLLYKATGNAEGKVDSRVLNQTVSKVLEGHLDNLKSKILNKDQRERINATWTQTKDKNQYAL